MLKCCTSNLMNEVFVNNLSILLSMSTGPLALVLIIVLARFAKSLRLLDKPSPRKKHVYPVPMVGGVSIYLTALAALLFIDIPEKLEWLIATGSILVVIGFLDDVFSLGVKARFFAQLLAASAMILGADLWVTSLGIEWFGLNSLGVSGLAFTIFAVVGLTNAFNMADGIDGLSAGYAIVALMFTGLTMWFMHGQVLHIEWMMTFFSACFAFWLVNMSLTPFKRVFLGDAGSLYIGFVVSWMLIYYSQQPVAKIDPVAALWSVALPVWDTLVVIVRRIKNGHSPFASDRHHFHHLLVDMGINSRKALVIILGMTCVIGTFGIWITYALSPTLSLMLYVALFLIFGCGMLHPRIEKEIA